MMHSEILLVLMLLVAKKAWVEGVNWYLGLPFRVPGGLDEVAHPTCLSPGFVLPELLKLL